MSVYEDKEEERIKKEQQRLLDLMKRQEDWRAENDERSTKGEAPITFEEYEKKLADEKKKKEEEEKKARKQQKKTSSSNVGSHQSSGKYIY